MIPTNGTHSPFDSDACIEWAIYCHKYNHDPNIPIYGEDYENMKKLNNVRNDEPSVATGDHQGTEVGKQKNIT